MGETPADIKSQQEVLNLPSLAASGTKNSAPIRAFGVRTLTVTGQVTFNASATLGAIVNVFTSPDGKNWDTIAYATVPLTLSAGNKVQRTVLIDLPEQGYIRFQLQNLDTTYTLTKGIVWYTTAKWKEERN